jgi:ABC-type nitrate/sulfonate/bicarbonate transport system permease component
MNRRAIYLMAEIATPVIAVAALWAFTESTDTYYYPPLGDVVDSFRGNWLFDRFASDLLPSLGRLLAGYAIAALIGIGCGVVLGQFRALRRQASPVVEFLRAIPPPALIPFTILVFGIGAGAKVFLIAFVCVWPILLNTIDGVAGMHPTLLDTGRAYRISARDRLLHVSLPAASPQISAGMRTSLSLALILMVISEMVASTDGIGYFVLQAQRTYAITDMWSGILLLGILGYGLNAVFTLAEHRILAWHRGARASAR